MLLLESWLTSVIWNGASMPTVSGPLAKLPETSSAVSSPRQNSELVHRSRHSRVAPVGGTNPFPAARVRHEIVSIARQVGWRGIDLLTINPSINLPARRDREGEMVLFVLQRLRSEVPLRHPLILDAPFTRRSLLDVEDDVRPPPCRFRRRRASPNPHCQCRCTKTQNSPRSPRSFHPNQQGS